MKKNLFWPAVSMAGFMVVLGAVSCGGAKSGRGFHLPDGDIEKGKATFVQLGCNQCHSVAGVDLGTPAVPGPVQIELGGAVFRVKTYGQLVTSIIDPSHVVNPRYLAKIKESGQPSMPDFTNTMTVRQMVDVVAFLHAHYTKISPDYKDYSYPYAPSGSPFFPGPVRSGN